MFRAVPFDPCVKCGFCKGDKCRQSIWLGTPFDPGKCRFAKLHWEIVGTRIHRDMIRQNCAKRLHKRHMRGEA